MADDAVTRLRALIHAAAPELTEERLDAISGAILRDMGGEKHYFPKAPSLGKALRLGEQLAAGVPLAQAFETVGVSRRHGYRLISRRFRFR